MLRDIYPKMSSNERKHKLEEVCVILPLALTPLLSLLKRLTLTNKICDLNNWCSTPSGSYIDRDGKYIYYTNMS